MRLVIDVNKLSDPKSMRVLIAVDSKSKTDKISAVFGRSKYFALYDVESKKLDFVDNPGSTEARGAGMTAGQFAIDNNISKVVVTQMGPNAENVLKQGGIEIVIEADKTLEEILQAL